MPIGCLLSAIYLPPIGIVTSLEPHWNFAESLPIHYRYLKPPQRSLHAQITACFFLISLHNSKKCCTFAGGKDKPPINGTEASVQRHIEYSVISQT